jgi:hypothetical protein
VRETNINRSCRAELSLFSEGVEPLYAVEAAEQPPLLHFNHSRTSAVSWLNPYVGKTLSLSLSHSHSLPLSLPRRLSDQRPRSLCVQNHPPSLSSSLSVAALVTRTRNILLAVAMLEDNALCFERERQRERRRVSALRLFCLTHYLRSCCVIMIIAVLVIQKRTLGNNLPLLNCQLFVLTI